MEALNCYVAIGGERDNTVPKYGISPTEAAVLRALHGDSAVHDIEPAGDFVDAEGEKVSNRDELRRVREIYSSPQAKQIVDALFPGMGAKGPETIDDVGFDESLFKPTARATADSKPTESAKKAAGSKSAGAKGDEDGVKDMPKDNVLG